MNLIFDLGNVLIEWNKDKYLKTFVEDPQIRNILDQEIFLSGRWSRLDSGEIHLETLEMELLHKLGNTYADVLHAILYYWYDSMDIWQELNEQIVKLKKQGHRIYILSNASRQIYTILERRLPEIRNLLDGMVVSCEEGCIKPERRIYEILLSRYHLHPDECLFFDDLEANVKAAQEIGIHAMQVLDHKLLIKFLTDSENFSVYCKNV